MHEFVDGKRCDSSVSTFPTRGILGGRFIGTTITMDEAIKYSITGYQSKKKLLVWWVRGLDYLVLSRACRTSSGGSCFRALLYTAAV